MAEGFFSPESAIWRVDREMILLAGGGRALLMQLAHPKVAAGVADHSGFREDPLARLHRTMNTMWSVVFDDTGAARASVDRVNEIHQRVRGGIKDKEPLPEGTPYDALDPELLLWVHATLVDTALRSYEIFAVPLSAGQRNAYYNDTKKLAYLFGIAESRVPASLAAFNDYVERMLNDGAINVGPSARAVAREILHPRPWILKPGGPIFSFITAGLLPASLREGYGLRWNGRREAVLKILGRATRLLLPLVPKRLRIVPHARAAEKRQSGKRKAER